jgi:hypothetical protein
MGWVPLVSIMTILRLYGGGVKGAGQRATQFLLL